MPKRPFARAIASMFTEFVEAAMPHDREEVAGRKVIAPLAPHVMAKLEEAGARLGSQKLTPSTRDEIRALFKKKAA